MKYYSEDSLSHPHHPNSDDDSERTNRLHEIISEQEELENLRWRENARNEESTADFLSFAEQTRSLYDESVGILSPRKQKQLRILTDAEQAIRESAERYSDEINRYCNDSSLQLEDEAYQLKTERLGDCNSDSI